MQALHRKQLKKEEVDREREERNLRDCPFRPELRHAGYSARGHRQVGARLAAGNEQAAMLPSEYMQVYGGYPSAPSSPRQAEPMQQKGCESAASWPQTCSGTASAATGGFPQGACGGPTASHPAVERDVLEMLQTWRLTRSSSPSAASAADAAAAQTIAAAVANSRLPPATAAAALQQLACAPPKADSAAAGLDAEAALAEAMMDFGLESSASIAASAAPPVANEPMEATPELLHRWRTGRACAEDLP
eukprot:TRINITY_DN29057_c0_g1_i2.p2 TRINITY_DN29057_c0_g1~~TRINITY_DN29057_c0_g1_i2.p2  ORF type:complete len:248 (-),score=67.85 TRINITY_DN29057_c0_g1_i2:91-834(-)